MSVSEYAQWWSRDERKGSLQYLKDWHLAALEPDYAAYEVPPCLGEDWLNEHWAACAASTGAAATASGGDHRFVYVGPAGSRTRLHADVLFSYSWSANVVGSKRWRLVPEEQRHLVSDAATLARKPNLDEIPGVAPIEIIQKSGELLFVPSGWFHEVENLTDCISINHNWLNAHNAAWALTKLLTVLKCIKAGLDAEDGIDGELCEDLLDRRCGMGLSGLCELLEGVIARRTSASKNGSSQGSSGSSGGGGDHNSVGGGDANAFAIRRAVSVLRRALEAMECEYEMEALPPEIQGAMVRQGELVQGLDVGPEEEEGDREQDAPASATTADAAPRVISVVAVQEEPAQGHKRRRGGR